MNQAHTVIIGGGISGLATSALLAKEGHRVTLVEKLPKVGGRAGILELDGFRFDTGPSWYLMPEVFEHFFELMGTSVKEQLDLVPLDPAYRVFREPGSADETPIDVRSGRSEVSALFEKIEPGAGKKIGEYLDSAAGVYEQAVSGLLYDNYQNLSGFTKAEVLKKLPSLFPLLTGKLSKFIDSRFEQPILRQILGYPAVFLGGAPSRLPSLYHLMSHLDLAQGVLYPKGGFYTLVRAIEKLALGAGVEIKTGVAVSEILTSAGKAYGVALADGTKIAADHVVSAADLRHSESLLPESLRSYSPKWWAKRTPSPGALLLMLGVKGELKQLVHHNLLFTNDWDANFADIFGQNPKISNPASIYICKPSATDSSVAPEGFENLFVLVPVPALPQLGKGSMHAPGDPAIEQAADQVIEQIAKWCRIEDLAQRIVVRRTYAPGDFAADFNAFKGNSLGLAHTLVQSGPFRPRNISKKVKDLYYAGATTLPGIGLPMCLISAELVVKRIRGDKSAGKITALPEN